MNVNIRAEILILTVLVLIALVSFLGFISEVNKKYGIETPVHGGVLREGIIGNPRFINPLLAQSDADRDVASLVYAGLFTYNNENEIVPALAKSYEVSADGLTYTVNIKDESYWSDGKELTAEDVFFTIQLAKNPIAQSPRRPNWEGVEIEVVNEKTVRFYLKKAYAPFLENLTLGILPMHLWEKIPPSQIFFAELNTDPIGAGPYKITFLKQDAHGIISSIKLKSNKYYSLGKPFINNLRISFYQDEEKAFRDLQSGLIDSLGAISAGNVEKLAAKHGVNEIKLNRIIAVFLNQSSKKIFASAQIRSALDKSVDKKEIVDKILGGYGEVIDGPLPQPAEKFSYDLDGAKNIISKQKNQDLGFTLTTVKTPELAAIAEALKIMWERAGFKIEIKTFPFGDLEQSVIGPRRYEAFLYGEEVIGKNPDLFAFWHSSQRLHPGYNIALYTNSKVDKLLEEVRTVKSESERAAIYKNIQTEIRKDLPATFLFTPSYLYATPKYLGGINTKTISTASNRFATIHQWYLKRTYIWKIFLR